MYNIIEVMNSCIEAIIIVFYIDSILIRKEKFNIGTMIGIITTITLILSFIALFLNDPAVQIVSTFILMMSVSLLFYTGKFVKKAFISAIFIIIIFASESIFMGLLYILNYGEPIELLNDGAGRIIGMIGSKILYFWLSVYVCQFLKVKIKEITFKNWITIILVPILSVVILNNIFISSNITDRSMVMYIISVLSILILNFYIFNYFDTYDKQLKMAVMEKIIEAESENYKLIEDKYEEIRQLKHDIKNQITIAKKLFESDRSEALRHLNNLTDELSEADGVCHTGTASVDAIGNMKLKSAMDKGIKCVTKIIIDFPISADNILLCRIIANALDNAIEACERYSGKEKYIYFVLYQQENNLYIEICNSSNYVDITDLHTEKDNVKLHGIGLKSIDSAVKNLNGIVDIEFKNNIFIIKILI